LLSLPSLQPALDPKVLKFLIIHSFTQLSYRP
jgi:hypothetical protein